MAFFKGTPARTTQVPLYNPQQQQGYAQILQQALSGLQNPSAGFQPIAENARQAFATKTIPTIAERFAGMGGVGSSSFRNTLGEAGAGLESNLAALGSQYGLQHQGLLQQLLGLGLQPQFESIYHPEEASGFEQFGLPILQALSSFIPIAGPAISAGIGGISNLLQSRRGSQAPMQAQRTPPQYQPYQSQSFNNLSLLNPMMSKGY